MLKLAIITLDGKHDTMYVDQIEFVRTCRYSRCHKEFQTINIDQLHCSISHKEMAFRERKYGTIMQARSSLSTTGLAFA